MTILDLECGDKECLLCMSKVGHKEKVYPLADWSNPKIVNYYCREHFIEINEFQEKQRKKYEFMLEQLPREYIDMYIKKDSSINRKESN